MTNEGTMTDGTPEATSDTTWSISIELSPSELGLVRTSLRHLLTSEDDPDEIAALKRLLSRLPEAPAAD